VPVAGAAAAEAAAADASDLFDAVVLTIPVPQLLELGGDVDSELRARPQLRAALAAVQYSSRYALALFWRREDAPAAAFFRELPWACRYVSRDEDPDLVFLSACASKRGVGARAGAGADEHAEPPSLLVHSSVPFALKRMATMETVAVGVEMAAKLAVLLPGMPPPAETRASVWRYSQVRKPLNSAPAALALGDERLPLILAGDAYSVHGSRFDGCYDSARRASELLLPCLGGGSAEHGPMTNAE
jgi:predicted NAD/FAD-dependent oxidoreductase